jgi:hypothetical protein
MMYVSFAFSTGFGRSHGETVERNDAGLSPTTRLLRRERAGHAQAGQQ